MVCDTNILGQHVHLVIAKKYAMKILLYLNKHLYSMLIIYLTSVHSHILHLGREDTLHIIQALINVCFESDNDLKISALTLMQILLEQGGMNIKIHNNTFYIFILCFTKNI